MISITDKLEAAGFRMISGYETYAINRAGLIKSWGGPKQPRYLKPSTSDKGYHYVDLFKNGKGRRCTVHSLVLITFRGPRPQGYVSGHLNGKRTDNRIENLEWITPKENTFHMRAHGTLVFGERHTSARMTTKQAQYIIDNKNIPTRVLSKKFGLSINSINRVKGGYSWKHLPRLAEVLK